MKNGKKELEIHFLGPLTTCEVAEYYLKLDSNICLNLKYISYILWQSLKM